MVSGLAGDAYTLSKCKVTMLFASDSIQRAITRDPKTAKPKNFSELRHIHQFDKENISQLNIKLIESDNSHVASSNEIQSYKEIISKQDNELKDLKSQIASLQNQVQQMVS